MLVRFDGRLSVMEILTRGGGSWVSNPRRAAANHGLLAMSRRSRRCWVTPIAWYRSQSYCAGLFLPGDRKSVEPMAARMQPGRVQAAHQSLHHFIAKADWSDDAVLAAVRAHVLPVIERHGRIRALS